MAVCVAVIGKENAPKFITSIDPEHEINYHYILHTSLDYIEERLSFQSESQNEGPMQPTNIPLYLGLLYATEEYKIYGYVTNTKVKFLIVIDANHTSVRDNEIRSMFRQLHTAYADVVCNPFSMFGDQIKSRKFENLVHGMLMKV